MKKNLSSLHITYIGHATLLIEMDGLRLLTDPILRHQVWHLRRQQTMINELWYQKLDGVLISHLHWDHLDLPSLRRLDRDTLLIVPQGAAALLRGEGFRRIKELQPGHTTRLKGATITATYAHHQGTRWFGPTADCLGFVIEGSHILYFAGDTDLFPEMADLTNTLDVALLPVWGWGPTLGDGHLDPFRAAQALQLLEPRLAVPIHWGTFFPLGLQWMWPHLLVEPPHTFAEHAAQLAPGVAVEIILPGATAQFEGLK